MIFVGVILLIAAVICYFSARSQSATHQAMNAADTFTAQMLIELHKRVTTTLGSDALAQPCEVEGVIECERPLKAPVSGKQCVAFTRTLTREYEEDVTSTDSNGKRETRTEHNSETLESDDQRTTFWVRDASGRTQINPDDAELDLVEAANRFDPVKTAQSGRTRTLGQRSTESILPLGAKVYVLGCLIDSQGTPVIANGPSRPNAKFMISRRTERELAQSAASWSRNLYYAAVGSTVLGVIVLLIGLAS